MIYLTGILLFLLLLWLLLLFTTRSFGNRRRSHTKTPADYGISFMELKIPAGNDKNLYGWLVPDNEGAPVIILVHGWGRNVGRTLPYIEALHGKGYHLLAFDARNHGNSDRDKYSTMKKFAEDILSVLDYLDGSHLSDSRGYHVLGLSIGGSAALYAAAHDRRIRSVVTVGALADPLEIMKKQLAERRIPFIPLGFLILEYVQWTIGLRFSSIAPEKHIGRVEAELLLIHGEADSTIPVSHADRLKDAAKGDQCTLWKIPGREHSDCHLEPGFWTRILEFFSKTELSGRS